MARRGKPKRLPEALKLAKGTAKPSRASAPVVPTLEGEPVRPAWLKGGALKVWNERIEIYRQRGQSVRGLEGTLAQYCATEARLIDLWRRRVDIPVTLINQHRIYANDFYDTPASQQQSAVRAKGDDNPFARNGQRPDLRLA